MNSHAATPTALQLKAARKCAEKRVPFALWAMPGDAAFSFTAAAESLRDPQASADGFYINFFDNAEDYPAGIAIGAPGAMGPEEAIALCDSLETPLAQPEIEPAIEGIDRMRYLSTVHAVVDSLKARIGLRKVVIARVIAAYGLASPVDVAADYWASLPDTMRWIAYTPETGLWLGATPELLLEADTATGAFHTMALAGTRPASPEDEPLPAWDRKNTAEHDFVVRYINAVLTRAGATIDSRTPTTRRFGSLEHRQVDFTGHYPAGFDLLRELYRLSPTPAVAGMPHDEALACILTNEVTDRHCYSGFVCVKRASECSAWVNLRCAFASQPDAAGRTLYNVYAGGGITSASKPADEWAEGQAKAERLLQSIK